MKLGKRILRNRIVQALLTASIVLYIRFVNATTRWEVINGDVPRRAIDKNLPGIGAAWHGRIGLLAYAFPETETTFALISQGPDGELMTRIIEKLGFRTVRGSARAAHKNKSKGGERALRSMVSILEQGRRVLITPDGPHGPRMHAKSGIITLARLSGVPIYPLTYAVHKRLVIRSWDRFILPLPFNRGVFIWGKPISVPGNADKKEEEALRRLVETQLNTLTRQADEIVGQTTIEPAQLKSTDRSVS